MLKVLLVRHAAHDDLGERLSGRTPGRPLTTDGMQQAARIAASLAYEPIVEVHSSPVLRARQTAAPIGDMIGQPVAIEETLDEIDFGCWAGRSFAALDGDPRWHEWNSARAIARAPDGETMAEAQARAVGHVFATARRLETGTVAMVSHCDIIRAVLCHALGLSLDDIHRLAAEAGSISRVECDGETLRAININEVVK